MANKAVDKLNSYLPSRLAIVAPKLGRKTKQRELTFGSIISSHDADTHYGFVYSIDIVLDGARWYYIGSKSFKVADWSWYQGSSKSVKALIKAGHPTSYKVLALVKDSLKQALAIEQRYITQCRSDGTSLNLADVCGNKLHKQYANIFP
jgi:hypothetical protein